MASSSNDSKPLSPHLSIWRWHPTMLTSILHRATGVALYVGAIVLTIWLAAAAIGPGAYEQVEGLLLSPLGRLVLFGFTYAAMFHLLSGVRHLIWDAGTGFSPKGASAASVFILLAAGVATFAVWLAAYFV
ncbi:MAG: succinate dehydrogenase, cytochrome b556 subunit [Maricaulaceae bacterium]|jgi:succinate dehydrogenase / fumarate reductase cytochrome b subunit